MTSNLMKNELRSDHLFLLVGTNPLPNWVAAKLLLNPGGRVHLFSTDGVRKQAGRLKKVLEEREKIPVSAYETADADEQKIFGDIERQASKLAQSGTGKIGLNYTGGTKMMSVHANRAMRQAVQDEKRRVLSYLDARTLAFKIDDHAGSEPLNGLQPENLRISLETLLDLHDQYNSNDISYERRATCPLAAKGLVEAHSNYAGQRTWREWCDALNVGRIDPAKLNEHEYRNVVRRLNQTVLLKLDEFIQDVEVKLNKKVSDGDLSRREAQARLDTIRGGYRQYLAELKVNAGDTLQTVAQVNGFNDSLDLAKWLDGMWLEHYALAQIQSCSPATQLNPDGCAVNLETRNKEGRRFEADVIALRGYQLFYFSCYSGSEHDKSKQKLFEAVERAAQLGGDEAKVALVCNHDKPKWLRQECEADWEGTKRNMIRVFGREDLPRLTSKLEDWFTGKPE